MIKKFSILILVAITIGASVARSADGFIPLGDNEYEFLYDRLERASARLQDRIDYQLGPYRFDQLTSVPGFLSRIESVHGEDIALFGSIAEQATGRRGSRPTGYEAYRGGFAARPMDRLFLYGNFVLDEHRATDPNYRGKKWRGLAGDVEQAFASYQTRNFDLIAGRFGSFWGMRHSLILGPQARMDGFGYQFRWGKLTISYRLAALDPLTPENDSVPQQENRYWAGHRIDLHLSNKLRVGLFETIVWGGVGRSIEPAYLNPMLFFHAFQLNRNVNDNTFLGFDFDYKPIVGLKLYGLLMIDDYQIEKKSQGDQEPNEYGALVGGYYADLKPGWDLQWEYRRVTNRTYNQGYTRNRYLYEGQVIGSVAGNDYDQSTATVHKWINENLRSSLYLSYARQGQADPSDPWTEPWLDVVGHYSEQFPTGVVQKQFGLEAGIKGYLNQYIYFNFTGGLVHYQNFRHQTGVSRTDPQIQLTLSAFGSTRVSLK
jgi:hypothetical protein